jgi:hypothetical protein
MPTLKCSSEDNANQSIQTSAEDFPSALFNATSRSHDGPFAQLHQFGASALDGSVIGRIAADVAQGKLVKLQILLLCRIDHFTDLCLGLVQR